MARKRKRKSVTESTKPRWLPGQVRMWTEENKRAKRDKRAARGRTYKGD